MILTCEASLLWRAARHAVAVIAILFFPTAVHARAEFSGSFVPPFLHRPGCDSIAGEHVPSHRRQVPREGQERVPVDRLSAFSARPTLWVDSTPLALRHHYPVHATYVRDVPVHENRSEVLLDTSGPNLLFATRACVHGKGAVEFFNDHGPPILSDGIEFRRSFISLGFSRKFSVPMSERPAPDPNARFQPGVTMLIRPPYPKHITHFTEAVMGLFHCSLYPSVFPWCEEVENVLVLAPSDDYPYNNAMLKVLLSFFPRMKSVTTQELFATPVCAEKLVVGGMVGFQHWGSLFADAVEAHIWRSRAFELFKVPQYIPKPKDLPRVTLILRRGSRGLSNADEVLSYLRNMSEVRFVEIENGGALETLSFDRQIQIMRETDILIGVHGSGLNNAIFLNPGSSVIEIYPGRFFEPVWSNAAEVAGVHWHMIIDRNDRLNEPQSLSPSCSSHTPWENYVDGTCTDVLFRSVSVDLGLLDAYLRLAAFRIQRVTRPVFQTGDVHQEPFEQRPAEVRAMPQHLLKQNP